MTLISLTCTADSAHVLTDTAMYTPNLRHLYRTTKLAHLHHLDAVVLAGGLPTFGSWVRYALETHERAALVADFDELLAALPDVLTELWEFYDTDEPSDHPTPGVVIVAGFSHAEDRFLAVEFGSDDDFAPDWIDGTYLHPTPWRLRPSAREYRLLLQAYEGLGVHPDVVRDIREGWMAQPAPAADMTPGQLIELAHETREDRSMGGGIPIAGDLVSTTLRRGRAITKTVWTFPESGPNFERFIEGTDHPLAQAADCTCGSGQNILACCRAGDLDKPCRCFSGALFRDCCMVTAPVAGDVPVGL